MDCLLIHSFQNSVSDLITFFPAVTTLCFKEVCVEKRRGLSRLPLVEAVLKASAQLQEVCLKISQHEIKLTRTTRMLRDYSTCPSVFREM